MSVTYKGTKPKRNYTVNDFRDNKVILTKILRWTSYDGHPNMRAFFRSNGFSAEIRTTCYHDTYAIDVRTNWWNKSTCLTTECKSLKEAKSILFTWFEEQGFYKSMEEVNNSWTTSFLKFDQIQLTLF
jgi:hypothetical protein